jgi:hypothetical protein
MQWLVEGEFLHLQHCRQLQERFMQWLVEGEFLLSQNENV